MRSKFQFPNTHFRYMFFSRPLTRRISIDWDLDRETGEW